MTFSSYLKTTQTSAWVLMANCYLVYFRKRRMVTDRFHVYEKGHKTCTPVKVLTLNRVVPLTDSKNDKCIRYCQFFACLFGFFMFLLIICVNLLLGTLFRIIDVPVAIINVLLCSCKTGRKFDPCPSAGESYIEYLVCCTLSLIVNAVMPADLEALLDTGSCEVCFELGSACAEEFRENYDSKLTGKESHELEKTQKYFDKNFVVEDKNPCGSFSFVIIILLFLLACCCILIASMLGGGGGSVDTKGLAKIDNGSTKLCVVCCVNEEELYENSANKLYEDGPAGGIEMKMADAV